MKAFRWKRVIAVLLAIFAGLVVWSTRPTPIPPDARAWARAISSLKNVQSVLTYLALYAQDHGGRYPASLDDLAPDVIDQGDLDGLLGTLTGPSYVPDLNDSMPGNLVILRMRPDGLLPKELIGYLDGSCAIVKRPEAE